LLTLAKLSTLLLYNHYLLSFHNSYLDNLKSTTVYEEIHVVTQTFRFDRPGNNITILVYSL